VAGAAQPLQGVEPELLRNVAGAFPTGVSIVTATTAGRPHGCGDHTIFVGRVVAAETGASEPIVFYRGRFTSLAPME
jgi:flavin reductase (DIM6/NTAB) family NADH-FMN oxidoreductase RutF